MQAPSSTFPCPHCGATYPRNPKLVGRNVRCTACRQGFRLDEDGIARPLAATLTTPRPSAPTTQPTPPPTAQPTPPPAAEHEPQSAAPEEQPQGRGQSSRRLRTARFDDKRREMAATLTGTIAAAVKKEEARAQAEVEAGAERRKAREGGVGQIGPVVLLGEGERAAAERRRWQLGCLAAVLLIALVIWLGMRRSPEERAVEDYCAPVPQAQAGFGRRAPAISARAVAQRSETGPQAAPFIDLPRPRFQRIRRVDLAPYRAFIHDFASLVRIDQPALWIRPEHRADIERFWRSYPRLDQLADWARTRNIPWADTRSLRARLLEVSADQDVADLIWGLLTARRVEESGETLNPLGSRMIADVRAEEGAGELLAVEWRDFTGRDGRLLFDQGGGRYVSRQTLYRGRLVRTVGARGRTGPWQVWTVAPER
jgi:hypothetical protein